MSLQPINEVAQGYRDTVELLNKRIAELKKQRKYAKGEQLYNLNTRICKYEIIRDEARMVANKLEHYYDNNK